MTNEQLTQRQRDAIKLAATQNYDPERVNRVLDRANEILAERKGVWATTGAVVASVEFGSCIVIGANVRGDELIVELRWVCNQIRNAPISTFTLDSRPVLGVRRGWTDDEAKEAMRRAWYEGLGPAVGRADEHGPLFEAAISRILTFMHKQRGAAPACGSKGDGCE